MSENGALSTAQLRAVSALLSSRNVREAAQTAGVAERTLTRWRNDTAFVAALRAEEEELLDAATRRLLSMQALALDKLEQLLFATDKSVCLRAAQIILTHLVKLRELRDIEQRLLALEAQGNGKR